MLIALINLDANEVLRIGLVQEIFPGTQFADSGPDDLWLAERGARRVKDSVPHDERTQKLVPVQPYIDGLNVITVAIEPKTEGEMAAHALAQADKVRAERDKRIQATNWLVERHRDQVDASIATTLAQAQYLELLGYRQALRDVPEQAGFPYEFEWPVNPLA